MNNKYKISFVVPVYKSENTIESVVEEVVKTEGVDSEIILVNDNSPDNVDMVIRKLLVKFPNKIKYYRFRKNQGQHAAVVEGLRHASKDYVLTIDDDGQNPPGDVIKMISCMNENDFDVVYGLFKEKKHPFLRRCISKINGFISVITIGNNKKIPITNVRLIKNTIAKTMASMSTNNYYIEGLIFSITDHVGSIGISHRDRIIGKSSYNIKKIIKLWTNHMIGYSNILIKSFSLMSFSISVIAFLVGIVYLILTINNSKRPTGWLSTYLTMTFLFSTLFMILGIIIEYIGRIYVRTNQDCNKIIEEIKI